MASRWESLRIVLAHHRRVLGWWARLQVEGEGLGEAAPDGDLSQRIPATIVEQECRQLLACCQDEDGLAPLLALTLSALAGQPGPAWAGDWVASRLMLYLGCRVSSLGEAFDVPDHDPQIVRTGRDFVPTYLKVELLRSGGMSLNKAFVAVAEQEGGHVAADAIRKRYQVVRRQVALIREGHGYLDS